LLTRKHFKVLARIIKDCTSTTERNRIIKDVFLRELCWFLKVNNPRFDEIRFRNACQTPYDEEKP